MEFSSNDRRPRVLIGLGSDILFRNFVDSRSFTELADRYETYAFKANGVKSGFPEALGIRDLGFVVRPPRRETIRYYLRWLSLYAGRYRSSTMLEKSKSLGWRLGLVCSTFGLPGFFPIIDIVSEAALGQDPQIKKLFNRVVPDVVIIPSQGNDSLAIDILKIARGRRIPVIMLNYNWDNMASKGIMRLKPDVLCVWGDDMAQLAERVHCLRRDQIKVIGAAQFEHYFDQRQMALAANLAARSMTLGVPRLLFAGGSRGHPEMPYLEQLETAIENGRLPPLKVIYRPHPWRGARSEKNFYEAGFRHVEMDPQLSERFTPENMNHPRKDKIDTTFKPDLGYYPVLLQSVIGVVSPLSTLALEAALVGRPILAMNMFEENWLKHALDKFEHLQRLRWEVPGVIECDDGAAFTDRILELIKLAEDPSLPEKMREAVGPIVYRDDKNTYGQRLTSVVNDVLNSLSVCASER